MAIQVKLSEREKEVAELLQQGKSNKQIAADLNISVRAVEFHLSNIYVKLGVTSRTEAALKLAGTGLRESTGRPEGENLRDSAVDGMGEPADNDGKPISVRRIPMKTLLYIVGGGLLITMLIIALAIANTPARGVDVSPASETPALTAAPASPTATSVPTVSSKEHILEQIRQLAAEYDQAVQAEKKNGKVEFSQASNTKEDIFLFKDDSYTKISELFWRFMQQTTQLGQLYTIVYRDEIKPTPFPAQSSAEQDRAYYEFLLGKADDYCSLESWQQDNQAETILIYDPDEGRYRPLFIGDTIARCEVYGQMLEEFRVAPMLAKVNKDADMAMIRQITGSRDLRLTFQSITPLDNAPWQNAALYTDETGTKYYVDIDTARLATIEPNFPTHPEIPANQVKSVDELRALAEQFALANSPRLVELKPVLLYEEGVKGNFYFFRWDYRNKDWNGTDWAMMPPFLQVGVLADGQVVTYINTLDLYK